MSRKARGYQGLGLLLILTGVFFLGINYGWLSLDQSELWAFFIILGGLFLVALSFSSNARNSILFGVIVTGVGLFFLLREWGFIPWSMELMWPVFLGLVGLGLLASYHWASRDRGLLVLATIMLLVSLVFLAINFNLLYRRYLQYWPGLLILIGAFLLFKRD